MTAGHVLFKVEVEERGATRMVRVSGRLGREEGDQLLRVCANRPRALRLDLTDLVSADDAGIDLLAGLQANGAELFGAPPYISLRLRNGHVHPRQSGSNRMEDR